MSELDVEFRTDGIFDKLPKVKKIKSNLPIFKRISAHIDRFLEKKFGCGTRMSAGDAGYLIRNGNRYSVRCTNFTTEQRHDSSGLGSHVGLLFKRSNDGYELFRHVVKKKLCGFNLYFFSPIVAGDISISFGRHSYVEGKTLVLDSKYLKSEDSMHLVVPALVKNTLDDLVLGGFNEHEKWQSRVQMKPSKQSYVCGIIVEFGFENNVLNFKFTSDISYLFPKVVYTDEFQVKNQEERKHPGYKIGLVTLDIGQAAKFDESSNTLYLKNTTDDQSVKIPEKYVREVKSAMGWLQQQGNTPVISESMSDEMFYGDSPLYVRWHRFYEISTVKSPTSWIKALI